MKRFYEKNRKLIFLSLTWLISIVLILNFRHELFCCRLVGINGYQFTIITMAILLLLLPFLQKLKIGTVELVTDIDYETKKVEEQIDKTISQSKLDVSNKFEKISKVQEESSEIIYNSEEPEWKIAKSRIEIEKALRLILDKRISISNTSKLDIKFFSLNKLFSFYLEEFPESRNMGSSFKLFNQIANAVVHGQHLSTEQIDKGLRLGVNIMRYLKIKTILVDEIA